MSALSHRLWIRCLDAACASATAPFLVALTRGTLAKSSFKAYIAQDAFYLDSFKQAFASAAHLCRKDADGFGADHFTSLESLIENELKMHAKFALELDIDLAAVRPFPQTLLYTQFLDATAKGQCVSHICAATTPCLKLYGWLGERAYHAGLAHDGNPYARWIREYASSEFGSSVVRLEMLLDHYATKENPEERDLLVLYAKALELEYNFFSAHETPNWNGLNPLLLAIDFDDTISKGDTISLLCRAALHARGDVVDSMYQGLLTSYTDKYKHFMETRLKKSSETTSTSSSFRENKVAQEEFKGFMEAYTGFETDMLLPAEQSGILAGLTPTLVRSIAEKVPLQSGAKETIEYALKYHPHLGRVHVISINWCRSFLSEVLQLRGLPAKATTIHANELVGLVDNTTGGNHAEKVTPASLISTGSIERSITGPEHKATLLRSLIIQSAASSIQPSSSSSSKSSIYVGDSLGDLSALLEADIGIILGNSSSLQKVCAAYGIEIRSLDAIVNIHTTAPISTTTTSSSSSSAIAAASNCVKQAGVLYRAESWDHIGFCVFGRRFVNEWLARWTNEVYVLTKPTNNGAPSAAAARQPLLLSLVPPTIAAFTSSNGPSSSPRVLTVAGSDSGGGAGIQADMKTCDAFNVFSTTAITGLTAQNTKGVSKVAETSPEMLRAQLDAVLEDIGTDSLKTGMVPSVPLAQEVARAVIKYGVNNLVVDPVMVSTSGCLLMDPAQGRDIVRALFPLATIVTPNVPEAEAILSMVAGQGLDAKDKGWRITTIQDMEKAAKQLYELGPSYVLLKGGHLGLHHDSPTATVNSTTSAELVDVLYDGNTFEYIRGPHVDTPNVHGTGCTLSTAIACELAKGSTVLHAVHSARRYLTRLLSLSADSKIGRGSHGPMLHMSPIFHSSSSSSSSVIAAPSSSSSSSVIRALNPIDLTLYGVTDSSLNEKLGRSMEDAVAAAVAGGATVIQIREKHLSTAAFVEVAKRVKAITQRAGVPLIINDRVDVALAIDADGVHVGQSDMTAKEVRRLIGPHRLLGVSTKTPAEAMQAQLDGADYVGTGAVYPTNTKVVTREIGVPGLLEVTTCPGLYIPVVAIGGIAGSDRVRACLQGGKATGIAVVSAIFGQDDVRQATAALLHEINTVKRELK